MDFLRAGIEIPRKFLWSRMDSEMRPLATISFYLVSMNYLKLRRKWSWNLAMNVFLNPLSALVKFEYYLNT